MEFTKKEIRTEARRRINELSFRQRQFEETSVINKLKDLVNSKNVLIFMPLSDEINIMPYTEYLLNNNHNVFIPITFEEGNMSFYKISKNDLYVSGALIEGNYGILEPAVRTEYIYNPTDVIVVPGLAFDKKCNRSGRGKGFYDRFLHKYPLCSIAVAYNAQVFDELITDDYDIPMNYLVTERFVYKK